MKKPLHEAILEKTLLGDGAMGTQLQQAGLEPGGCGEAWNVEHPDRVLAIQKRYVEAGSDCLITNTFGGSRIMLERHAKDADVAAINKAGAMIAREAFGEKEGYVLGDIGPFGGLLEPYGEVAEKSVRDAFAEQARALVDGGVDAIIIETQTSLEELGIGLEAAREAGAPCVIGSMAYDVTFDGEEIRTMMGIGPEDAAEFMAENGADVVALNCGSGIDVSWAARAVERYRRITELPTMAQPNAGLPELVDMEVVYRQTPEEMTGELSALLNAGANIVGGCCGSSPDHLRLFRKLLDETQDGKPEVES
ncbi:MAG: homocysteine S-methyltransferase family protein [Planctomycetota bacterium]|nr:homocysteine S-methyltransferase family protein [Planctomycetota bacterium]MEC9032244.1 homocysteine S-methyltransferase family protein [Planctomycetota bacterium]MEE3295807.1 homocysteine S-methyltransferase family protein [Planctomycetota bacterium]